MCLVLRQMFETFLLKCLSTLRKIIVNGPFHYQTQKSMLAVKWLYRVVTDSKVLQLSITWCC